MGVAQRVLSGWWWVVQMVGGKGWVIGIKLIRVRVGVRIVVSVIGVSVRVIRVNVRFLWLLAG